MNFYVVEVGGRLPVIDTGVPGNIFRRTDRPMVMKKVRILTIIAVITSMVFFFEVRPAGACSCAREKSDERSLKEADAAFAGYAIEGTFGSDVNDADDTLDDIHWTFLPDTTVKGVSGRTVEVSSPNGGASCGVGFDVGRRYLVFAYRGDGDLRTDICTNTRAFHEEVRLPGAEPVEGIYDSKPPPPTTHENPSWVVRTTVLSGVFLVGASLGWLLGGRRRRRAGAT